MHLTAIACLPPSTSFDMELSFHESELIAECRRGDVAEKKNEGTTRKWMLWPRKTLSLSALSMSVVGQLCCCDHKRVRHHHLHQRQPSRSSIRGKIKKFSAFNRVEKIYNDGK